MSDGSKIEWTDATVNVINGCSVVSPGCTNCYAMKQAHRFPVRQGLTRQTKGGMVWTGEVRFHEPALEQVLRWKRPRRIFWNAHGDTFHESVPDEWIDRCFAAMALTPHHTHQVLTKRPRRAREYLRGALTGEHIYSLVNEMAGRREVNDPRVTAANPDCWPLPSVWLGTSVEDQHRANERIPILLDTPAAVRWLSAEPLLGPVDLRRINTMRWRGAEVLNSLTGTLEGMFGDYCATRLSSIDWVVAGGESGPGARPMHPDWVRSLRDQCAAAGVAFLLKQWGAWLPGEIYTEEREGGTAGGLVRFPDGPEGQTFPGKLTHWWDETDSFNPGPISVLVGKGVAGRRLDGQYHDGYPA